MPNQCNDCEKARHLLLGLMEEVGRLERLAVRFATGKATNEDIADSYSMQERHAKTEVYNR